MEGKILQYHLTAHSVTLPLIFTSPYDFVLRTKNAKHCFGFIRGRPWIANWFWICNELEKLPEKQWLIESRSTMRGDRAWAPFFQRTTFSKSAHSIGHQHATVTIARRTMQISWPASSRITVDCMQMRSDSDNDARSDSLRSDRRTNLAPDVSLTDIRLTVIQTPLDFRDSGLRTSTHSSPMLDSRTRWMFDKWRSTHFETRRFSMKLSYERLVAENDYVNDYPNAIERHVEL